MEEKGNIATENRAVLKRDKVVEIKGLHKQFGSKKVLNGVDLDLYDGENLVVMGKSGTGKSVLIKCLVGLVVPDSGDIAVLGWNYKSLDGPTVDTLRTKVGFLFQAGALYDSMTVRENLEFPLRRHRENFGTSTDILPLVKKALENVGLGHTLDLMPEELSGGMQKRVALARTLVLRPKIILYDEPTTGLDAVTSKEINELINNIRKNYGTSSIIITHDLDCARTVSDRIVLLLDGVNYIEGTFKELSTSTDPRVSEFFEK